MEINEKPLTEWMDEHIGTNRRFKSVNQWAKMARMASSTVDRIYNHGTATVENVVQLARAAGVNPKDVFIRIGWWDEELPPEDQDVQSAAAILAQVPDYLRPILLSGLRSQAESLQLPGALEGIRSYLQAEARREGR